MNQTIYRANLCGFIECSRGNEIRWRYTELWHVWTIRGTGHIRLSLAIANNRRHLVLFSGTTDQRTQFQQSILKHGVTFLKVGQLNWDTSLLSGRRSDGSRLRKRVVKETVKCIEITKNWIKVDQFCTTISRVQWKNGAYVKSLEFIYLSIKAK